MSEQKQKPRESMLVTADMPTDYIATNGYEYVLKSKYQALKEQADKLEKALEKNKSEWEAVNPNGFKHMVAWQIARQALEEYRKSKGMI